jgi:hypothetical protein
MSRKMQTSNRQMVATNHFVNRVCTKHARFSMAHENAPEHPLGFSIRWLKPKPPRSGFSWRRSRQLA